MSLLSKVVYHHSLKRKVRVVMVWWMVRGRARHILLASSDLEMCPWEVYHLYNARFQIEFVFRDAKQYCGLQDSQVRDAQALHFHFNLSLATLNLLRVEELARGLGVISIASAKRRKQNEDLIYRLFSRFEIDPERPENQIHLRELRDYGVIAA